jgi:hypothetical protein
MIFCHYGVARPEVEDGGNGLQIWRVAARILYKNFMKGLSSSLGGLTGVTTSRREKKKKSKLHQSSDGQGM